MNITTKFDLNDFVRNPFRPEERGHIHFMRIQVGEHPETGDPVYEVECDIRDGIDQRFLHESQLEQCERDDPVSNALPF